MPGALSFHVVFSSGEDSNCPASELNSHGPTVRGWQTAKNCEFPQEVVMQLYERSALYKLQVLAHQYLIPERVEIFVSNDDISNNVPEDQWSYLGYIILSDNQGTGFKSRELKSVNLPTPVGTYVKLKLSKNHTNTYNIHNQVCLVAVSILGVPLDENSAEPASKEYRAIIANPQYLSPYDDLSFEMYVDADVQKIIKKMELKKHLAVKCERFEYARKLKSSMEALRPAGERLGKYDLEKRHAIEREDYERARYKKNEMEKYRSQIYQQLKVEQLLEEDGVVEKNDEPSDTNSSPNSPTNNAKSSIAKEENGPNTASPMRTAPSPCSSSPISGRRSRPGSFRRRNRSIGASSKPAYDDYEERALPALRHSQTNEFLRDNQAEQEKIISKLSDRERKQASLPILLFGLDVVELFYSKHYCDKEDGLNLLKDELRAYDDETKKTANKIARATIFLLHRTLRDKVFSVYSLANEIIRIFFVEFVPGRVSQAEVARSVDKLLPELLIKSGDTSSRIHQMAVHTILTMADCKNVRELHYIPVHLSRPVSSTTHPRLALSRMEMVEQLIINQGISTDKQSGLTCRTLAEFGASGLHHPAEAVRKVAERVLVLIYKVNPRLIRKQLPPDDDITRRNLLYRQLFHEFDKLDLQRKKEMMAQNMYGGKGQGEVSSTKKVNGQVTFQESSRASRDEDDDVATAEDTAAAVRLAAKSAEETLDKGKRGCIFCLSTDDGIDEAALNLHYLKKCPMLTNCLECGQVVEISALSEHLVAECERKNEYFLCSKCRIAVRKNEVEKHQLTCQGAIIDGESRCPLCANSLQNCEIEWRKHLAGTEEPCLENKRNCERLK